MSPRPYRLGQRRVAAEQTRTRVIAAARELLTASGGFTGFTIDAVAAQAGVARMTVYYQFGSKAGLLEALFDDLAARGGMDQLPAAFSRADPLDALAEFIALFCRFWASERLLIRRLQGLAASTLTSSGPRATSAAATACACSLAGSPIPSAIQPQMPSTRPSTSSTS